MPAVRTRDDVVANILFRFRKSIEGNGRTDYIHFFFSVGL